MTPLETSVFVHSKALCDSEDVGPRTRVWAFANVMQGARVGADCNVCGGVFIESGAIVGDRVTIKNNALIWDKVTIEDDAFIGPNVVFTNDLNPRAAFKKSPEEFSPTLVRRGVTIGANATIVCGLTIGEQAFVGAGSVVTKDVPAHALTVGNPSRRVGWMCTCGLALPPDLSCSCGRSFKLVDDVTGLRPL